MAPKENRGVVVDPPCQDFPRFLEENLACRAEWEYDFQGTSSRRLIEQARGELLEAAVGWRNSYGEARPSFDPSAPIFLAGHQPQMFHPGVWLKNFALCRLAARHGATAVNLIIDSDVAAKPSLFLPVGSMESPSRETVAYDLPEPAIPYEERRIEDRAMFESFAVRATEKLSPFVRHPLLEKFWPMVIEQGRRDGRLGASLAQARHLLENAWGCRTWEVPQSTICDQPAFFRFAAHLLAAMPRFLPIYNEAVAEYRRENRIRNHAHPVPDLAVKDDWLESPFWIWSVENPHRRRLFVRSRGNETAISDRHDFEATLSLSPQSDGEKAVEQLAELRRQGIKIRSRALITTLWARLALGDFFIHGIGGGHYDRVTDTILERFFGIAPPHYMILSATLQLPIERQKPSIPPLETVSANLRELIYHPERFLNGSELRSPDLSALVAEKRRWIETAQTRENAKERCRSIRGINERLQPWLGDLRLQLERRREQAAEEAHKERILHWREYAFCLYPEEFLRNFFGELLKGTSLD